jgi:purine nucleosidase
MHTPTLDTKTLLERLILPVAPIRKVLDTDTFNEIDEQFALSYALQPTLVHPNYVTP